MSYNYLVNVQRSHPSRQQSESRHERNRNPHSQARSPLRESPEDRRRRDSLAHRGQQHDGLRRQRHARTAFGKAAFHLQKADTGDGPGEEYDVLLDGQFSTCECKGFLRHGMKAAGGSGCKHIAGCKAALDAGQLKASPVASKPAPAVRVVRDTCFNCDLPYANCKCTI